MRERIFRYVYKRICGVRLFFEDQYLNVFLLPGNKDVLRNLYLLLVMEFLASAPKLTRHEGTVVT